jgi:hypothetical protein
MHPLRRGFSLGGLLLFIFGLALLLGILLPAIEKAKQDARKRAGLATLKLERRASWSGALCAMDVFVNGLKIGSVGNGVTQEFTFTPRRNEKNTLYVEIVAFAGPSQRSPQTEFMAGPGAVISVTSAVEKEGSLDEPLPEAKAGTATSATASKNTGEQPWPWEAIGAIAGVASALLAIVAIMITKSSASQTP